MAKISLCLIVGNVGEYIQRCLESFLPVADEICMVRAIGNQHHDGTIAIAKEVAERAGIPFKFAEYKNRPGHEDWPHIDSFCAARQMSFDLASHPYAFWADSDDILKCGAEKIRQHANNASFASFIFPYDIFGKNAVIMRDRMMLKDSGTWKHAVHECFKYKVEPVTAAMDESVIIQHLPRLDKKGGNERNLRILESMPPEDLHIGLKYHMFGELMCAGRKTEAIQLATDLLIGTELGKDERYDLLMSIVLESQDLDRRVDFLHLAHKADPERREALGVLSGTMLDLGRPASALAYARQMMATVEPDIHSWNSRQSFYGYTGDDIYMQALRANGRIKEAEMVRLESLKRHGGPTIALLHATRGRPEKAAKCRKAWNDLAVQPGRLEHIFAIDEDDTESRVLKRFHHVTVPKGGGCVAAWNYAAQCTEAHVLLQLSDDWIPVPKWDELILQAIGDVKVAKVLAINDGHRTDDLLCMAICTRSYYNADYFLFHPWFTGVYSDNWFTKVAYSRGCVIQAKHIVFDHQHPAFDPNVKLDKTYAEQNAEARYVEGEKVLKLLEAGNDWSTVPGWFNYWSFYQLVAQGLKAGDLIAEVGVWLGRSVIYMAQELQRLNKQVKIYAVDHFKGESNQVEHEATVLACDGNIRQAFEANVKRCGVAGAITVLDGESDKMAAKVADGSLMFCWLDAAHDYESVKRDIAAWKQKVKRGGTLAGHDAQWPEVVKAVKELLPNALILGPIWVMKIA